MALLFGIVVRWSVHSVCLKDELPEDCPPNFCMNINDAVAYYYQVQEQLDVCNVEYGDFILWTENGLAIERIIPDPAFKLLACKVEHLLVYCQR